MISSFKDKHFENVVEIPEFKHENCVRFFFYLIDYNFHNHTASVLKVLILRIVRIGFFSTITYVKLY